VLTVVLDTNLYVSTLLVRHGVPAQIFRAWRERRFLVATSTEQLEEVARTLSHPRIRRRYPVTDEVVDELLGTLRLDALIVPGTLALGDERLRDPKDAFLLTIAAESRADVLVSGDQDLLVLERFGATRMMNPRSFWEYLEQSASATDLSMSGERATRGGDREPPAADPHPGPTSAEPANGAPPPPTPRAGDDVEMGGEAPCQLHRFWDVEE
jgi:hypothetical protein